MLNYVWRFSPLIHNLSKMRFDKLSFELDLKEDERCFYHRALAVSHRPMCLGVTDKALFIAREKFLKIKAYGMQRIPLEDVKDVILSRERGPKVWLKWSVVLAFGIGSMITMAIGLWLSPNVKPGIMGTAGPLAFALVGLIMLIDGRWRLVLTIRTPKKDYRWRPNIFDSRDNVKELQEGFLSACHYAHVRTQRLDLVNKREINGFWKWFENDLRGLPINVSRVEGRLHKLCDRIDVEIKTDASLGTQHMVITANYAADAFPIVEELVFAAPKIPGVTVSAFRPRQNVGSTYRFSDRDYPLGDIFFLTYTDGFDLAVEIYAAWESFEDPEEFIWALYKDLLGEYDVAVGVRYVELRELCNARDPSLLRHISQLPEVVDGFNCLEAD